MTNNINSINDSDDDDDDHSSTEPANIDAININTTTTTAAASDATTTPTSCSKRLCQRKNIIRICLFSILLGFILFVIIDTQQNQYVKQITQDFLSWVEEHPLEGIFSFIGVYFIATVLFIPGSILTLGSGFIFANVFGLGLGLVFSTIAVFVGASLGSIASFLFGRYLFQDCAQSFSNRYQIFEAVNAALQVEGLKIMILLRLSPIIPFNAINYILGVTSVKLRDYALACFAMLPGTVLYTFLGSSAGSIVESASSGGGNTTLTIVIVVIGVVFGVVSIGVTTYYAKRELNKIIDNEDAIEDTEETPATTDLQQQV